MQQLLSLFLKTKANPAKESNGKDIRSIRVSNITNNGGGRVGFRSREIKIRKSDTGHGNFTASKTSGTKPMQHL